MNAEQQMVEEFHRQFEIRVESRPTVVDDQTHRLRVRLIDEEFAELRESLEQGDLPGIAKELADLLYVVYGTAVSYGLDMAPVFREVHRSNMSKVGGYKRDDGKWIKPATYSPADVLTVVSRQQGSAMDDTCHPAPRAIATVEGVES